MLVLGDDGLPEVFGGNVKISQKAANKEGDRMKALIGREIENMGFSWREASRFYSLIGIGGVLVMWVLGPRVLGVVSTESSYVLIAIMGLVLAFGRLIVGLERDEANRQLTFLQTLPVPKTNIIHAKFMSLLLLSALTIVWIAILFSLNMFVNGGKVEYWMTDVLFVSMFIFVTAMSLLWYYFWGNHRLNTVFYVLVGLWGAIFVFVGFILRLFAGVSFIQVMGLALGVSVLIYLICWRVVVRRVYRKGIPREDTQAEDLAEFVANK